MILLILPYKLLTKMKTETKTGDLLTYERISPYGYYAISIDGEKIAHAYESDLATGEENAKWICKRVNNYDSLLSALKNIADQSASLDNGVKSNSAGDKQISRLWEIAHEAIKKAEQ